MADVIGTKSHYDVAEIDDQSVRIENLVRQAELADGGNERTWQELHMELRKEIRPLLKTLQEFRDQIMKLQKQ